MVLPRQFEWAHSTETIMKSDAKARVSAMPYRMTDTTIINGDVSSIWKVVTDVASWSTWDPHYLSTGFESTFEVGGKGWTVNRIVSGRASHFTLIRVEPEKGFTTQSPMPLGKMLILNDYEQIDEARVRLTRRSEIYGAFAPVFPLYAKRYREDVRLTFAALEEEASRRAAAEEGH